MKEHIDYLSTLFVGIDIASRIHVVSALDFNQKFFIKMKPVENTQEGATLIEQMVSDVLEHNHQFKFVVIAMVFIWRITFLPVTCLHHSPSEFTVSIQRKLRTIRNPLTTSEKMMV